MMRLFLLALLLANVVMLLVLQSFRPSGVEPERLALQLHAERVTVQQAGKDAAPPPLAGPRRQGPRSTRRAATASAPSRPSSRRRSSRPSRPPGETLARIGTLFKCSVGG